ncbi:FAD-dependent monooxygenase [Candidatus Paracaedibacter symbiosus]|uniref:FAD-dependent monooxygenase n=1 Tax=Candidatus Paracaedibacter symbiosus TaxID=244582 RepID=UPI000509764F|nr:FAD-dependent monooxygenase [Candidatus Paracaedibacter symbiosus]
MGKFVAVKLNKWFIENKIIFLGDSAHGIFPFYGQGMNAALEDSKCLAEMLESFPTSREKAFKQYFEIRKSQTDILFKLSNKHFYILKNKGKTILYNTKYRLDIFLHNIFPKFWFHEYTMMSNSLVDIKKISRRLSTQRLYILFPLYWVIFLWVSFIEITDRIKRNFAKKI